MIDILNEKILILLIVIFIIISQFDLKYIVLILIIIFLTYQYYDKYINNINVENDIKFKFNDTISILFSNLKGYKNSNLIEYKYGLKYWSKFIDLNQRLNNGEFNKYGLNNSHYENAETYLYDSIKHFESLILVNNDPKLKNTIDNIFKEGLTLLKKSSIKLNHNWNKNPNIFENQIIFNMPKPYNRFLMEKYNM